ncbi:TPA: hypothetical protein PXJ35_002422 [Yersinia enterocolitica]|nr:hypothetical protein [Yersinia enterocolitica]HDL6655568.1 hypothetical protein [Yersinia enterocolitica]HDL6682296.1 hypothetical protein [Yersinia enterocolitica]
MKPHYIFSICLLATSVLTGCVQSPERMQSHPTHPLSNVSLSCNTQSVHPDAFAIPPEVIRYDRYLLVNISCCHELQHPPAKKIATTMAQPLSTDLLVGH